MKTGLTCHAANVQREEAKLCVVVRHQASTSACRGSVALVHVVVQIMSLTMSRHNIRLHPACQHVCCLVVALIPCEAPRQRTSSTLPSILSWTTSKLKPASRYLFHIPANIEFLRSRDRAQRKRSRSSQQLGSGKQLKSTQLINFRCKIAVGGQLWHLLMGPPNGRIESGNMCQHRARGRAGHGAICLFLCWLKIAHNGPPVDHPVLGAEPAEPQLHV